MLIHVLLFAAAKELAGADSIEVHLPPGSTVKDLSRHIAQHHPQLEPILPSAAWSVDQSYAPIDQPLIDGCEVGLILPVSGG